LFETYAFRIGLGRSFHHQGTVNTNVLKNWFCASQWRWHEALLTYQPQASGVYVES